MTTGTLREKGLASAGRLPEPQVHPHAVGHVAPGTWPSGPPARAAGWASCSAPSRARCGSARRVRETTPQPRSRSAWRWRLLCPRPERSAGLRHPAPGRGPQTSVRPPPASPRRRRQSRSARRAAPGFAREPAPNGPQRQGTGRKRRSAHQGGGAALSSQLLRGQSDADPGPAALASSFAASLFAAALSLGCCSSAPPSASCRHGGNGNCGAAELWSRVAVALDRGCPPYLGSPQSRRSPTLPRRGRGRGWALKAEPPTRQVSELAVHGQPAIRILDRCPEGGLCAPPGLGRGADFILPRREGREHCRVILGHPILDGGLQGREGLWVPGVAPCTPPKLTMAGCSRLATTHQHRRSRALTGRPRAGRNKSLPTPGSLSHSRNSTATSFSDKNVRYRARGAGAPSMGSPTKTSRRPCNSTSV